MFQRFDGQGIWSSNHRQIIETTKQKSCDNCERSALDDREADFYIYNRSTKDCTKLRTLHRHNHDIAVITDPVIDPQTGQVMQTPLSLITHDSEFGFSNEHHRTLFIEKAEDDCKCRQLGMKTPHTRFVIYDKDTKQCMGISQSDHLSNMTMGVKRAKKVHKSNKNKHTENKNGVETGMIISSSPVLAVATTSSETVNNAASVPMNTNPSGNAVNQSAINNNSNTAPILMNPYVQHQLKLNPNFNNTPQIDCPNCVGNKLLTVESGNKNNNNNSVVNPNILGPKSSSSSLAWIIPLSIIGFILFLALISFVYIRISKKDANDMIDSSSDIMINEDNQQQQQHQQESHLEHLLSTTNFNNIKDSPNNDHYNNMNDTVFSPSFPNTVNRTPYQNSAQVFHTSRSNVNHNNNSRFSGIEPPKPLDSATDYLREQAIYRNEHPL